MFHRYLILSFLFILISSSCNKGHHPCYDRKLDRQDKLCLQDCPGVLGCDGKIYCNECIANGHGISIVE